MVARHADRSVPRVGQFPRQTFEQGGSYPLAACRKFSQRVCRSSASDKCCAFPAEAAANHHRANPSRRRVRFPELTSRDDSFWGFRPLSSLFSFLAAPCSDSTHIARFTPYMQSPGGSVKGAFADTHTSAHRPPRRARKQRPKQKETLLHND